MGQDVKNTANRPLIRFSFDAYLCGDSYVGSFDVQEHNIDAATEKAMDTLANVLVKLPEGLDVEYNAECVDSNAPELIEKAVQKAVNQYSTDNVDIQVDDRGIVSVIYHSDNNSFAIEQSICTTADICDDFDIKELADKLGVGYWGA